jgi:hypothetical protein
MEVHVKNVPQQGTENGLKKFLKPHFNKLSILAVGCQKQRGKVHASLTFLHLQDADRFLALHGQPKLPPGTRRPRQSMTVMKLMFLGQPIYCEKSDRDPNPHLLRVLAKEEKERQQKSDVTTTVAHYHEKASDILPLSFECASVSCGVWRLVEWSE